MCGGRSGGRCGMHRSPFAMRRASHSRISFPPIWSIATGWGETYRVRYNPAHRWFYVPEMRADEAVLIKCYDSVEDGTARFTAHSAFEDPTASPDVLPRQSIEVRTLVFHHA